MFPKDTEAPPGGVDDMTKLSYLHEPGVLQNLATRYELNEIYVRALIFLVIMQIDRQYLLIVFYEFIILWRNFS